jgi:hypothetical protein
LFGTVLNAQANCATGTVAAPIVDSITVDIAGNVTICWQAVPDPDVVSYTIFMINPVTSANDSINTVAAPGTCFTLPFGMNNSDFETVELGVVAIDLCNNSSPVGVNYHNTIYLDHTVDICAATINLNWNGYDDFPSGTNLQYKIYVSENAGPYTLDGTTTVLNYSYTGINQGSTYDFYVVGIENNGAGPKSSSSNDIQINTLTFLKDPGFNYLYTVNVVDSEQVNVQFYVDTAADISHYDVLRANSVGGTFNVVSTISAFPGMNPMVTYIDNDVSPNQEHYVYKVETYNTCQDLKFTSNIGKSIWLGVESDGVGAYNTLTITSYQGWDGFVNKYDIYRSVGGVWESSPIATISPFADSITYQDNILNITAGDGEFCYRIRATENVFPHVDNLPRATSTSNEDCVVHNPLIYVPNAFAPLSPYNYSFKPVLTFSNPEGYLMQIYNRWGLLIFETKDINEAWTGSAQNSSEYAQTDSYVYLIKFQDANGEEHSKRGLVSLLR